MPARCVRPSARASQTLVLTIDHPRALHVACPGPVSLDGLRVNQLSLARRLSGEMALTEPRLLLKGRGPGRRGDELMELDLALPPSPLATRPAPGPDGVMPVLLYCPPAFTAAAHMQRQVTAAPQQTVVKAQAGTQQQQQHEGGAGGGGEGGDGEVEGVVPGLTAVGGGVDVEGAPAAAAASVEAQRVSHVLLRRGDLHFSSTVRRCGDGDTHRAHGTGHGYSC